MRREVYAIEERGRGKIRGEFVHHVHEFMYIQTRFMMIKCGIFKK